MPTIIAAQLRRGHKLILPRRGIPTVYQVERVIHHAHHVEYDARPISGSGHFWNGRITRELDVDATIDILPDGGRT